MFENTLKNLKKTLFSIQIAFYLIIIIHLCYCTIVFGDLLPNLPLLLITVAYLAFLIVISEKNGKATRLAKKSTKKAYRWAKILIKGVTLFITVNAFSSLPSLRRF